MLCVEMVLRFVRLNTSWASPDVVDSTEFLGTFGYPSERNSFFIVIPVKTGIQITEFWFLN